MCARGDCSPRRARRERGGWQEAGGGYPHVSAVPREETKSSNVLVDGENRARENAAVQARKRSPRLLRPMFPSLSKRAAVDHARSRLLVGGEPDCTELPCNVYVETRIVHENERGDAPASLSANTKAQSSLRVSRTTRVEFRRRLLRARSIMRVRAMSITRRIMEGRNARPLDPTAGKRRGMFARTNANNLADSRRTNVIVVIV